MSWTDLQNDVTNFQGALSDIGKQRNEANSARVLKQDELQNQLMLLKAKAEIEHNTKMDMFNQAMEMFGTGNNEQPQPNDQAGVQQEPAMSLPSGQFGTVQGAPALTQKQPSFGNRKFLMPKGYEANPNFAFGEGGPFVKDPNFINPNQERLRKQNQFLGSTRLRQEFINRPEVKDYITVKTATKSMDSLLKKAVAGNLKDKVSLDQALITLYNKMTDPQSVVRESEYARTPGNLPLVNRFAGAMEKIVKGGAGMTDQDREALVWGAKVIANERGRTYNQTMNEYKQMANEYDMEQSLITRGMPEHSDFADMLTGQSGENSVGGNNQPLDKQTAMQFLNQAGGDKDKARELAKQAGYTF